MLEALQKGDEVVTAGGVVGRITKLADQYVDRRDRAERRDRRAAQARSRRLAAEGHDQGAVRSYGHESLSALEVHHHRRRARRRRPLHAAQLLPAKCRRCRCRRRKPTLKVDARTARHASRRRSRPRAIPYRGAALDPTGVKVRFADPDTQLKAKDVAAGEARRELHRRAQPAVVVAAVADARSARCRCTSASTCAAACTSCCRST